MRYGLLTLFFLSLICCSSKRAFNNATFNVIDAQIDPLGNIYTLDENGTINSYNSKLEKKFTYSSVHNAISHFDVSNPQKIVVYSEYQNTLVFLDNTLSELSNKSLSLDEYLDITAMAISNDNNIWLWDASLLSLIKINDIGEELFRSDLMTLVDIDQVIRIKELGNNIFLQSKDKLYLFSNLGVLKNTFDISEAQSVNFNSQSFQYLKNNRLYTLEAPLYTESSIPYPLSEQYNVIKYFFDEKIMVTINNGLVKY